MSKQLNLARLAPFSNATQLGDTGKYSLRTEHNAESTPP